MQRFCQLVTWISLPIIAGCSLLPNQFTNREIPVPQSNSKLSETPAPSTITPEAERRVEHPNNCQCEHHRKMRQAEFRLSDWPDAQHWHQVYARINEADQREVQRDGTVTEHPLKPAVKQVQIPAQDSWNTMLSILGRPTENRNKNNTLAPRPLPDPESEQITQLAPPPAIQSESKGQDMPSTHDPSITFAPIPNHPSTNELPEKVPEANETPILQDEKITVVSLEVPVSDSNTSPPIETSLTTKTLADWSIDLCCSIASAGTSCPAWQADVETDSDGDAELSLATEHDRTSAPLQSDNERNPQLGGDVSSRALCQDSNINVSLPFANLTILDAALCTEVLGFANYREFDSNQFKIGDDLLIYCALDNYTSISKSLSNSVWLATRLKCSLAIMNDQNQVVQQADYPAIEDLARTQRKDFYMYVPLTVGNLESGRYRIFLTVQDLEGNKTTTLDPPLEIVVK